MTQPDFRDLEESAELAVAVRKTLEQAAQRPDPLLDAALTATRAQIAARQSSPLRRHPWRAAGGLALAASLAALLMLPGGGLLTTGTTPAVPSPAASPGSAMPDADLQMLQDMDELVALDEGRHEG